MRLLISLLALCSTLALSAACGSGDDSKRSASNTANQNSKTETTLAHGPSSGAVPPISSGHGSGAAAAPAPGAGGPATQEGKAPMETSALDAKIEKAEAKAKAPGATAGDKTAAAAAYLERANVYRDAGNPSLYKFALGDYRRSLRYDPNNAEAKSKMEEIVMIYQSMGRPVPENGLAQ